MQCPKCEYEPTMAEAQRSPSDCVSCGINYAGFASARSKPDEKTGQGRTKFAPLIAVLVLVGLGIAGYFGYEEYARRQFIEQIEPLVRASTVHLDQIISTQKDGGSMSFAELFAKASKSITDIDGYIVQASVLKGDQDVLNSSVAYMKAAQETIRDVSSGYRGVLKWSTANDRYERASKRFFDSENEYSMKYAQEARDEALAERDAAADEVLAARTKLNEGLKNVESSAAALPWFDLSTLPAKESLQPIE